METGSVLDLESVDRDGDFQFHFAQKFRALLRSGREKDGTVALWPDETDIETVVCARKK